MRSLGDYLAQATAAVPDRMCLAWTAEAASYGDLQHRADRLSEVLRPAAGKRVAVALPETASLFAALVALERLCCEAVLVSARAQDSEREAIQARLAPSFWLAAVDSAPVAEGCPAAGDGAVGLFAVPGGSRVAAHPRVVVLTSGTTGTPNAVEHTWESLSASIAVEPRYERSRWLLSYPLDRFAGLQVFLQCFLNRGTLAVPGSRSAAEMLSLVAERGVEFVSGTPSLWRAMLAEPMFPALVPRIRPRLRQITLGGEVVTQPVLDALRRLFEGVPITHVYASTEMGACFAVKDGRAGFPAALLLPRPGRVGLSVRDGELYIRRSRDSRGRLPDERDGAEWFATGDLVEIQGDRVMFAGRRADQINVGGFKVNPLEVEAVLREIDGVADVRVVGAASSLVGQVVKAEVVAGPGHDEAALRDLLIAECARRLHRTKVPRLISFVPAIQRTAAGKVRRRAAVSP